MDRETDDAYREADQGSFANLVLAMFEAPQSADAAARLNATRQVFVKRFGPIIYSRFGENMPCGVALTDTMVMADLNLADTPPGEPKSKGILSRIKRTSTGIPRRQRKQQQREHKWWLTQQRKPVRLHLVPPALATAQVLKSLSRCETQTVYARRFLQDEDLRQCLTLLYWPADTLISLADADVSRPAPEGPANKKLSSSQPARPAPVQATAKNGSTAEQLAIVSEQLTTANQYYQHFTQRGIRSAYFRGIGLGMLTVIGLFVILYAWRGFFHTPSADLLWSIMAGALGALTSVLTSATYGRIILDRAVGTTWNTFLGAFRPIIGGLFGAAFFVLINAGFLPLKIPSSNKIALYASIAFLAGFSQRWAQDTLKAAEGKLSATPSTPGSGTEQENATAAGTTQLTHP